MESSTKVTCSVCVSWEQTEQHVFLPTEICGLLSQGFSGVTSTTDFSLFHEDKGSKIIWNTKEDKSTNIKIPNHIEYTYPTTLKKCPLRIRWRKNVDGYKDYWKHTVVHTGGRDTTGQQLEKERDREKERQTEGMRREDSFTGSAKRWSNITKYSINNIHKEPGPRHILMSEILSQYLVLLTVVVWIQNVFFFLFWFLWQRIELSEVCQAAAAKGTKNNNQKQKQKKNKKEGHSENHKNK